MQSPLHILFPSRIAVQAAEYQAVVEATQTPRTFAILTHEQVQNFDTSLFPVAVDKGMKVAVGGAQGYVRRQFVHCKESLKTHPELEKHFDRLLHVTRQRLAGVPYKFC